MRLTSLLSLALLASLGSPVLAQEWVEFTSRDDGFRVNFPGPPAVTTTTFTSEYGAVLPARVYSVTRGGRNFSMTVIDYRPIEKLLTERSKQCPPFADERCTGLGAGATSYKKSFGFAYLLSTGQGFQGCHYIRLLAGRSYHVNGFKNGTSFFCRRLQNCRRLLPRPLDR